MKRKVALLQVLLPRTPLVILDEPTNTLDPTMRDLLLRQLEDARDQGRTVLFSSHVLAEVEKVCDRVGVLQRGKLVHVQKMNELREVRRVQATFKEVVKFMPSLPGVRSCQMEQRRLTCEYEGPLRALLDWLGGQNLMDLQIEPLGLAEIYRQYHGTEA
jgi:ABC-2 type transport system ATP-binding protein